MSVNSHSAPYKKCTTCDGFGMVTMVGKLKHAAFPNYEYDFAFSCTCEKGKNFQAKTGNPDYINGAQQGFQRKYAF